MKNTKAGNIKSTSFQQQNHIYFGKDLGIFIGSLKDNSFHKHYAIQICVSLSSFTLESKNSDSKLLQSCFITSNTFHRLDASATTLILLINPISSLGHQLSLQHKENTVLNLHTTLEEKFSVVLKQFLSGTLDFRHVQEAIKSSLHTFTCQCEEDNHLQDNRIYSAIQYLEKNFDRVVSLHEIASLCCLSETRFLHLFKEKTNINYRRYQLWNKLVKSLPYLSQHSITETAHTFGFTDSSHYTRTFRETFGLSPKKLIASK
ncbi:AraC family transcriptional regulator [Wandonia haliotis]|uniref:helix-turn-helix transcriptional regulator n=1 Tax=Wandonia haliotis TaxID=574963 RepID=UPI0031DD629B